MNFPTRRAFALLLFCACLVATIPTSAAVTLLGTIASQSRVPARLQTCSISVEGSQFYPTTVFAQQPNPVARYTVLLAFFDKRNVSVGQVNVTDHGADSYTLPDRSDSMTCAIARLTLDDGSVYPPASLGGGNSGAVALGVLGAGALIGIAIGVSHHDSSTTTAAPTATASSTAATPTPTPVPTVVGATPTPTPGPSGSPTPSPFPTSAPTTAPTLRPSRSSPHIVR